MSLISLSKTKQKKSTPSLELEMGDDHGKLTLKQEKFCCLYISKYFWNATQSYMEAYDCEYNTARNNWARLLANACIKTRVREHLDINGFTNENTDVNHLFLINQFEDFWVKLGAIKEYNRVTRRIIDTPKREISAPVVNKEKMRLLYEMMERIKKGNINAGKY